MIKRIFLAAFAIILGVATTANAQAQRALPEFTSSCPAILTVSYSKIEQRSFGDKEDDLKGFTPSFTPNTAVRLITAHIAEAVKPGEGITSNMPDNQDNPKAGEGLIYVLWQKGAKAQDYPAAVTCNYEGGLALQQAVPANMRSCTLHQTIVQPTRGGNTKREIISKANFICKG